MKIRLKKLTRNALKCNKCKDVIESVHRHDFNFCGCGSIAVDGGLEYTRRVGDIHNYTELSEYMEVIEEESDFARTCREKGWPLYPESDYVHS